MKHAMLRVLTLSTLFPNAGQPRLGGFVERQTRGLAALDGVAVEVVAPIGLPPWPLARHPHYAARARLPERETWNGLEVHRPRFPVVPAIGARWTAAAMARALLPRLRAIRARFPFDVVDTEFFWPDGPAAMRLAKALDVPFSIKARGSDIHLWGARRGITAQIVAAGRAADGLLAVSAAMRDAMAALGIDPKGVRVHHTGVDFDRFRPVDRAAARTALGVAGPLIVCVGTLVARKGQRLALAALEQLPGATLILVGDGPDRPRLEAVVRARALSDRVRLTGSIPHARVAELLSAADVMLLPSASEGLANVWVEALACGTPIVIAEAGGAREVLDRPAAGRLVPRDPAAIADAVRAILAAPPDPALVRQAAERFGWARNAAELRDHLAALVDRRRQPFGETSRAA